MVPLRPSIYTGRERMAFVVEEQPASSLGVPAIKSSRSAQENKPGKELRDLTGVVESEFVLPLYAGDNTNRGAADRRGPCGKSG